MHICKLKNKYDGCDTVANHENVKNEVEAFHATLSAHRNLAQTFLTTRFQPEGFKINNMGQKVKRFPAITFFRVLSHKLRPSPVLTEILFIFTIQVKMPPTRSTPFKRMWRHCEDISGRIVSLPVKDVITNKPFQREYDVASR